MTNPCIAGDWLHMYTTLSAIPRPKPGGVLSAYTTSSSSSMPILSCFSFKAIVRCVRAT